MQMVRLRNVPKYGLIGYDVAAPTLHSVSIAIESLLHAQPIAFYELVEIARNAAHTPFGNAGDILREYSLLEGTIMHDDIRAIVLASTIGDLDHLQLVNPVLPAF